MEVTNVDVVLMQLYCTLYASNKVMESGHFVQEEEVIKEHVNKKEQMVILGDWNVIVGKRRKWNII